MTAIVEERGEGYVQGMNPLATCARCRGFLLVIVPVVLASSLVAGRAAAAEPADTAPQSAPVNARWVSRKLHYVYQGFTAHYTCDGLQDAVKRILLQLGVRESDLVVKRSGCTRLEGPEPSPGVNATFSVLEPADSGDKGAANSQSQSQAIAARWESVTIQASTPTRDNAGGCELIEDVKKHFVPLFATRDLKYTSDCFPHTQSLLGANLKVDVLRAVKPPKPERAQH